MYWFFQNLKKEDREKRLFHFRGTVGQRGFRYEIASGPALALEYQHGEACDNESSSMIRVGFLFFTVYLIFYLPSKWYLQRKCIATWDNNREFYLVDGRRYGFYFFEWNCSWSFHAKINESSSKDPWWMRGYWSIPSLIFGRIETMKDEAWPKGKDVKFSLGGKEFVVDEVKWIIYHNFRRRVPFALYRKRWVSVDMRLSKPPMYSGKGENSWDCGDDGSYGLHCSWPYELPTYKTVERDLELAVELYVEHVMDDVRRYGGSSSERGVSRDAVFKYIGPEKKETGEQSAIQN